MAACVGIIGAKISGAGAQFKVEVVAASLSSFGRVDECKAVGRRAPAVSSGCNDDNHAEFDAVGMQFVTEDGLVV